MFVVVKGYQGASSKKLAAPVWRKCFFNTKLVHLHMSCWWMCRHCDWRNVILLQMLPFPLDCCSSFMCLNLRKSHSPSHLQWSQWKSSPNGLERTWGMQSDSLACANRPCEESFWQTRSNVYACTSELMRWKLNPTETGCLLIESDILQTRF